MHMFMFLYRCVYLFLCVCVCVFVSLCVVCAALAAVLWAACRRRAVLRVCAAPEQTRQ